MKVVSVTKFAKQLGFKSAKERKFRQIIELAKQRDLLKIVQGGYLGDSMHHPKLVELRASLDVVKFLEQLIFPSYVPMRQLNGYSLTLARTGFRRLLQNGTFSKHKWWICEDCNAIISIGQPYASKIDFSKQAENGLPVRVKCLSCFLDLIEEFHFLEVS